jgi:hypothetical protein
MILQHSRLRWIVSAACFALVAGCAAIPKVDDAPPPSTSTPTPPPPVVAVQTKGWEDRPLTVGKWRYDAARRVAAFDVASQSAPLVTLTCAGSSLRVETQAFAAAGQALGVDFKTSFGSTRLRFEPQGAMGSVLTLSPRDHKLDQMAFSRGRFALDASNGRTLTLPSHAEVGRAIEDCRG